MKQNTFISKSHFKIYDSIIPIFRLISAIILTCLMYSGDKNNFFRWNLIFIILYIIYAIVILLSKKIRHFIVYRHPIIIGFCEILMITYGISVTGGENSYLYFSYIMVIIFYGIIHSITELISITIYTNVSYFLVVYILQGELTVALIFKVTYLFMISIFIGLINGRIKSYNYDMAYKDQLTGLYNRHYLFGELQNLIHNNENRLQVFSILVIDVNDFKNINDTFGHIAGDRILNEIGILLKSTLKKGSISSRYGGDEFVILLMQADRVEAEEVRIRLYKEMMQTFKNKVSFSIGAATFPENGKDVESLIHYADQKMYEEKLQIKSLNNNIL